MKIAFIQIRPECSLGSMYIASAVKPEAECRVFIADYENDLYSAVVSYSPDILAFSTFTGEYKELLSINRRIREEIAVFSIFGGPHPTFCADMIGEEGVDAICRGEGEAAMQELIWAMKNGDSYSGIKNFYFKQRDGQIYRNELRDLQQELDKISFPDRQIYAHYFGIEDFKDNILKRVISARGCPFSCTYCYNHLLRNIYAGKGRYLRFRSVGNIIEEASYLAREYGAREFDFVDDVFGLSKSWLEEFQRVYKSKINLPFSCLSHFELLEEGYISELKRAGCKLVNLGLETGDEEYRKKILRRNYTNQDIYRKTRLLHRYKLAFCTLNMLLLPGETPKMAFKTLKINLECRPFDAWVAIYQPYPDTGLCDYAIKNNYLSGKQDTIPQNLFTDSILKNSHKDILLRLFYLFSFTVKFPYLYALVRICIYFPFQRFYRKIYTRYKDEIRKYYLFSLNNIDDKMFLFKFILNSLRPKRQYTFLDLAGSMKTSQKWEDSQCRIGT